MLIWASCIIPSLQADAATAGQNLAVSCFRLPTEVGLGMLQGELTIMGGVRKSALWQWQTWEVSYGWLWHVGKMAWMAEVLSAARLASMMMQQERRPQPKCWSRASRHWLVCRPGLHAHWKARAHPCIVFKFGPQGIKPRHPWWISEDIAVPDGCFISVLPNRAW